jgi:hypothetical protein
LSLAIVFLSEHAFLSGVVPVYVHRTHGDTELGRDLTGCESVLRHLDDPVHVATSTGPDDLVIGVSLVAQVVVHHGSREAKFVCNLLRLPALLPELPDRRPPTAARYDLFVLLAHISYR